MIAVAFVFITLLWWYLGVFLHELGHLCGALMVGWKPRIFALGTNHRRTIFRIGDLHFMLGSSPFSGFVHAIPRDDAHFRWKKLVFIAGGPIVTATMALVVWNAMTNPEWILREPRRLLELLPMLFMVEAWRLGKSTFPLNGRLEGRIVPNDGKMILQTLFIKRSEITDQFRKYYTWQIRTLVKEKRYNEARDLTLKGKLYTQDLLGRKTLWIYFLLEAGKNEEAEREISALLDEEVAKEERVSRLDGVACLPLYYGQKALLDRSLEYINRAIELAPDKITLKGTKGSLLIEKGLLDEGIRMLEDVLAETDSVNDKATSEYYLAFAYDKKGNNTLTVEHWNRALALDPQSNVRQFLEIAIFGYKQIS